MYARVVVLQHWKSEHSKETCQDKARHNIIRGLFVVADGVGTASYADVWADHLVRSFVDCPLLSNEPFEVEWWLGTPQARYKADTPRAQDFSTKDFSAHNKLLEGSQSTLLAVRVIDLKPGAVTLRLLAFGDSCALLLRAGLNPQVSSFPLQSPREFEANPICLPSKPSLFSRTFHQGVINDLTVLDGDMLILATDAVSKWVLSSDDPVATFRAVVETVDPKQKPGAWEEKVLQWRREHPPMADDDSTALVIWFAASQSKGYGPLPDGKPPVGDEVLANRRQEARSAQDEGDLRRLAIIYGDGVMLNMADFQLTTDQRDRARKVADAWNEVHAALGHAVRTNTPAAVEKVWLQHRQLLRNEPSVTPMLNSLRSLGIPVDDSPPSPPSQPRTQPVSQLQLQPTPSQPMPSTLTDATSRAQPEPPTPAQSPDTTPTDTPDQSASELKQHLSEVLATDDDVKIFAFSTQYASTIKRYKYMLAAHDLQRLELAEPKLGLLQAIISDDDARIDAAWRPDLRRVTTELEQKRVRQAHLNLEAFKAFRAAMEQGDQALVETYERYSEHLANHRHFSDENWKQLAHAQKRMAELELLREALNKTDDFRIVEAYDAELPLSPSEREQIDAAHTRVKFLTEFRQAITDKDYRKGLAVYSAAETILLSGDHMTDAERIWIEQARATAAAVSALEQAIANDDDAAINQTSKVLEQVGGQLSTEQTDRVNRAISKHELTARVIKLAGANDVDHWELADLAEEARLAGVSDLPPDAQAQVDEANRRLALRQLLSTFGEIENYFQLPLDRLKELIDLAHSTPATLTTTEQAQVANVVNKLARSLDFWLAVLHKDRAKIKRAYRQMEDDHVFYTHIETLLYEDARDLGGYFSRRRSNEA